MKKFRIKNIFKRNSGQTTVEYALSLVFAFILAMAFHVLYERKGNDNMNVLEKMFSTMESSVILPYP